MAGSLLKAFFVRELPRALELMRKKDILVPIPLKKSCCCNNENVTFNNDYSGENKACEKLWYLED